MEGTKRHTVELVQILQVIFVSDEVRNRLVRDYRFPERKIVTVHNGMDGKRSQRDARAK